MKIICARHFSMHVNVYAATLFFQFVPLFRSLSQSLHLEKRKKKEHADTMYVCNAKYGY